MRIVIQPNYQVLSKWVADYVAEAINNAKPTKDKPFVLGLPTGSSPLGTYQELIQLYKEEEVSFKIN